MLTELLLTVEDRLARAAKGWPYARKAPGRDVRVPFMRSG
jgi:hypothetical protein